MNVTNFGEEIPRETGQTRETVSPARNDVATRRRLSNRDRDKIAAKGPLPNPSVQAIKRAVPFQNSFFQDLCQMLNRYGEIRRD